MKRVMFAALLSLAVCIGVLSVEVFALRARQDAMEEQLSSISLQLARAEAVLESMTFDQIREPTKMVKRRVRVSTYNATVAQCGPNPEITASGARSTPGWHAAVSRDLATLIPMGSRVHVPGHGWWEVQDLMAESYQGRPIRNSMDLMLPLGAKHFAVVKEVEVVAK